MFRGLIDVVPLLVTAIPLGIYNFTEAMNNVESASAAGDSYDLRKILAADGIGAIVGSRITSYNVCYTKLLRTSAPGLRRQ